jgi:hypothetical protein
LSYKIKNRIFGHAQPICKMIAICTQKGKSIDAALGDRAVLGESKQWPTPARLSRVTRPNSLDGA